MATTKFGITQLTGDETAGYNSINTLINSVDNILDTKVCARGMVLILNTSDNPVGNLTSNGWTNLGATPAGLPALTNPYVYIKKA